MTLLLIILSLVFFSLISSFFTKCKKVFICISIFVVISFYLFLSTNIFHTESFLPKKDFKCYIVCFNYYNILMDSFKKGNLYLAEYKEQIQYKEEETTLKATHNFGNKNKISFYLLDTSFYKNHLYLYFGITPVLLFYLPFNLITTLYLTDKFLVFILSCFIFLLSLFLIKKILENLTDISKISPYIIILSIFTVGFCNLLPFLIMRSAIYEVAITTSVFLLLIVLCLFYYYTVNRDNIKLKYILIFFISLFLCLSVGARPNNVFLIPFFFFSIIYLEYKENKNFKKLLKSSLIFLVPCIVYGTILALYNYLRFDSIFEFGLKYQINKHEFIHFTFKLKDSIVNLKQVFFNFPNINLTTLFSLAPTKGHSLGNEHITGFLWTYPLTFILLLLPDYLKQICKKSTNCYIFVLLAITIIVVNLIFTSFFGILLRYIFEYLFLIVILSFIIFLFYLNETDNKFLKNYAIVLFTIIFIYMVFINTSLLFCKENSFCIDSSSISYTKLIKFLF